MNDVDSIAARHVERYQWGDDTLYGAMRSAIDESVSHQRRGSYFVGYGVGLLVAVVASFLETLQAEPVRWWVVRILSATACVAYGAWLRRESEWRIDRWWARVRDSSSRTMLLIRVAPLLLLLLILHLWQTIAKHWSSGSRARRARSSGTRSTRA